MILDKMYTQNAIIGTGLQASILRNEVITNNLANSDVPGYKKKTVEFESILNDIINSSKLTGKLELEKATPRIKTMHRGYNYRKDENNVDVETEMVDLYQNSVRYDTLISCNIANGKRLNLVLMGR